MTLKALAILSHPDDAELMCAGTLSLLKKKGWEIHMATMTAGDKGTATHSSEKISRIRKQEAATSAVVLEASYYCLGFEDLYLFYNREAVNRTTALIRSVNPVLVFTSSPQDYMADHEVTARIVQTACFAGGVKNMEIDETPVFHIPHLYYCDPMEGKDKFGEAVLPSILTDITEEMPVKEQMLACHASQREWLRSHHGIDEYILAMKRFAGVRGSLCGVKYAEGFRQHLGHGFPQNNLLKEVLADKVI